MTLPSNITFFFFNDTPTTEIYTLSLHDALPISSRRTASCTFVTGTRRTSAARPRFPGVKVDRKSTRLNSSHVAISYAVFCLKKKNLEVDLSHFGLVLLISVLI